MRIYDRSCGGAGIAAFTLAVLSDTIAVNVYLLNCAQGIFSPSRTTAISGGIKGDQDTSFQAMKAMDSPASWNIIKSDPAVDNVMVFTGSWSGHTLTRRVFMS